MNTAIFSPSGGNVGIAFAVPAALVKEVVGQLQEHGSVDRGWLGVVIQNVTDEIADSIGLSEAKGAMDTKVAEDGPAAKEDIKAGDVIVEVNGDKKLAALEEDKPEAGMQLDNLGLSLAPAVKVPGAGEDGVVITEVDPNSDAATKGLKAGDIILQVAGETVSQPGDVANGVRKALEKAKDKDKVNVIIQVKTGDQTRFVALSLKKAKV